LFFPVPVLSPNLPTVDRAFWQQVGLLSLVLMFPVAFLSGALLPAIVTCVQSQVTGWMNSTGLTILFNTAGAAFGPLLAGFVLLKKIEGMADTFQLLRRDLYGQPYYYRLITNSYSMSGTLPRSQRYMRLFAYLPLALRPESENALLIGYGVGVTADAFTHDA